MKNIIAALSLVAIAASAQAAGNTPVGQQEAFCQALANVAEAAAQGKANGVSARQAVFGLASTTSAYKVVSFVYASPLAPADAKRVVFARCLAGVYK